MAFKLHFSKPELLKLFLVCAFPIHFWTLLSIIFEGELIGKRNSWYFAGFSGYLLLLALLESVLFFLFIVILSFLFPKKWQGQTPLAVASAVALVLGFWAVGNQAFQYLIVEQPTWFEWVLLRVHYRQRLLYPVFIAFIAASVAVPVYGLAEHENIRKMILPVIENISLLSYLYLGLDLLGLVVVLVRNSY